MSPIVRTAFSPFWTSLRVAGEVRFIGRSRPSCAPLSCLPSRIAGSGWRRRHSVCLVGSPDLSRLSAQRHPARSGLASQWGQPGERLANPSAPSGLMAGRKASHQSAAEVGPALMISRMKEIRTAR
jgi:hypothetical protein